MAEPLDKKVRFVVDAFNRSKDFYGPLRSKFVDWDNMYYSIPDPQKYGWMENVFIPATFKAVRTLASRLFSMHFAIDPPVDPIPQTDAAYGAREGVKGYLGHQFDQSKLMQKWFMALIQCLVRGTSVQKSYWTKDMVKKVLRRPVTNEIGEIIGFEKVIRNIPRYQGPTMDVIDLYDYFPDPDATPEFPGIQIHRIWRSMDYLKKATHEDGSPVYQNLDKLEETTKPGKQEEHGQKHIRQLHLGIQRRNFEGSVYDARGDLYEGRGDEKSKNLSKDVEILECYADYDKDGDNKLEDCLFAVGNQTVLLRDGLNPFITRPFSQIQFMPVLGEIFGMGVCELIEPLQRVLNTKTNQRLDNVNQALQAILTYIDGAVDQNLINSFDFRPGGKLKTNMPKAIEWERAPDVTSNAYMEADIFSKEIEEQSGANRYINPGSKGQSDLHRTSGGLAMLQSAAGEWLNVVAKLMEDSGLRELARQYHTLNQQNISSDIEYPHLEKGVYTKIQVTIDDIAQDFDFRMVGATHWSSKEMETGFISQILQSIAGDPMLSVVKLELIKKVSKNFNMPDIENKIDSLIPVVEQQMQAQMQAQPAQGGVR